MYRKEEVMKNQLKELDLQTTNDLIVHLFTTNRPLYQLVHRTIYQIRSINYMLLDAGDQRLISFLNETREEYINEVLRNYKTYE